ncbi:2-keto-4-pentenoate hydratase [Paraburkholderia lycopersici]|uniref:2-keto-4-pentenoate hydratase n=1 Tax=Paraburkholderia lycopersici TaxID=416944 RepID=A0A1G6LXV7_9BURK|nr:fumarylacetoacetate hydrolase family protein [Paraburkholderia lycopersici]SDC48138.1 2-keto-4-pentenoate hydratase [Paraburkholderia lycopersici]
MQSELKHTLDDVAALLRDAERTRVPVAPLSTVYGNISDSEAYAIQRINCEARLQSGERVVGRKIGLTSAAVQKQLGVGQPDFGTLFASMAHGDGEAIRLASLIQPKIEAEVALVLKTDLLHERHTYADLLRAVDYALAAVEVVDSRIENWKISFSDTVSDNGSSARFVLGSRPVPLRHIDLANCYMELRQGGKVLSDGTGAACMGNPLNAAVWLADRMVREGTPLRAGDIVLTGALGPMVAVKEPGAYEVTIDGLGSVRAVFE